MGKSNRRASVKTNRRGIPRVKNRDSTEATGLSVEEVVEKIEERLAPLPEPELKPRKNSIMRKKKETN